MTGMLNRDAAREVLRSRGKNCLWSSITETLDALEGCVQPAPAQTIDRKALWNIIAGYTYSTFEIKAGVDAILALLRPAGGVLLTTEEIQRVLTWRSRPGWPYDAADDVLAQRLEAAS